MIRRYGGRLAPLFDVRVRREKSSQKERDRRPETWHIDWHAVPNPTVRQDPGLLIGKPPPSHHGLFPGAVPAIVPS